MKYRFTVSAIRSIKKLPKSVQKRIISKLDFFCKQEDPLLFSKPLTDHRTGSFRFRIGDYRIIFDVTDDGITILQIGHRREVYR